MWVPTFLLKASSLLLGEFVDETLLCSLRVFPKKLIDSGFKFQYPDLSTALKDLFSTTRRIENGLK